MATMTPFQRAFREAKDAGRPDFEFPPRSGKIYSTKTAEEQSREIAKTAKGGKRGESAGMTAKDAETLYGRAEPARAEIPTGGARAPAETGAGMSEAQRNAMNMLMAIPPARAAGQAVRGGLKAAEMARAERELAKGPIGLQESIRKGYSSWRDPALREQSDALQSGGQQALDAVRRQQAMAARSGSPATPLRGTNVTSETGRRFTPAEEMEAATAGIRGAAARKELASTRTGRSQAAAQAKAEKPVMRTEKKKETPRSRTRDTDEDVEFRRGGMTYAKGGSVRGAGCETRHKKTRFV
jgi:hypothetical protein